MDKYIQIIQEPEEEWQPEVPAEDILILECWSSLWSVSVKEQLENSADTMAITHILRIEYTALIDNDMKVKYGTRKFNIVGIMSLYEEDKITEITAEEIL